MTQVFGGSPYDSITGQYRISDSDETGSPSYYGFITADGAWFIMSIDGGAFRYCRGSSGYAAAWALRADPGTVYALYDTVF
jgi:hypothetical protein